MRCDVLTIFPEIFHTFLGYGMIKKAQEKRLLSVHIHDLREYTTDRYRSVDDVPYGGGPGMVMKVEPIHRAVTSIGQEQKAAKRILLSPKGRLLNSDHARDLAAERSIMLICGRYEGVDERVKLHLIDEEISIGDYVLSGGEIPAMALLEAVVRFIPGVLGNKESLAEESFTQGWLEYPQYTRPLEYEGWKVPDILLSGHHEKIGQWRYEQSLLITAKLRPDLIDWSGLTSKDFEWLLQNGIKIPLNLSGSKQEGIAD